MSWSARISRNTTWQLLGRAYTALLAMAITVIVLPRHLGADEFGVFSFHLTAAILVGSFIDFGAGTIVVREASRDRAAAGRLIGVLVRLKALVASGGVVVLAALAVAFEGVGLRTGLLALASLHVLGHALTGALVVFHVDMAFARVALANAAGQTAWLAGTVALVVAGVAEPGAYMVAFGLGPVASGLVGWLSARRRVAIRFDAGADERRAVFREAWPVGLALLLAAVAFHLDVLMLRPMAGEVAVARYSAASRLAMFALMVPQLFHQAIFPVFSRVWPRGPADSGRLLTSAAAAMASIGFLFPATMPPVADDLMALVYPPAYGPAAPCLGILSLALALVFVAYPHVDVLLAAGRTRATLAIFGGSAALNVLLNLALIPRFGIEGAAWSTVACEGLVLGGGAFGAARLCGVTMRARALLRPAACAAVAALALPPLLRWGDGWSDAARVALAIAVALVAIVAARPLPLDVPLEEAAPP